MLIWRRSDFSYGTAVAVARCGIARGDYVADPVGVGKGGGGNRKLRRVLVRCFEDIACYRRLPGSHETPFSLLPAMGPDPVWFVKVLECICAETAPGKGITDVYAM